MAPLVAAKLNTRSNNEIFVLTYPTIHIQYVFVELRSSSLVVPEDAFRVNLTYPTVHIRVNRLPPQGTPPTQAADTAHSPHNTQPALRYSCV